MLAQDLSRILTRDLRTLKRELAAYPNESDLWATPPGITNSAGNLALHLCGNLQHFIGAQLGATGYVRNRDAEFADRNVPRAEIDRRIDATIADIGSTFARVTEADLEREYPLAISNVRLPTRLFLTHLVAHFTYHLGQIDYHRRMVTRNASGVGAVAVGEL
jgi:uncharacterized damage-inducible protein DinB